MRYTTHKHVTLSQCDASVPTCTLPFSRALAEFIDESVGGFGFLEKVSVDKKHEPHAFDVFTVPGANGEEATERWKYKTLWDFEKNTGWRVWAIGVALWKPKPGGGGWKRPTPETRELRGGTESPHEAGGS
jgi:hypothetical protein